jgi:hypothetical protein
MKGIQLSLTGRSLIILLSAGHFDCASVLARNDRHDHTAPFAPEEMSIEDLHNAGIPDSMVRVSVGVEDWRDLLRDIRQAPD